MFLTTQTHLEADSKAGLHNFTDGLVGQVGSNWCQQQRPQHLKQDNTSRLRFICQAFLKTVGGGICSIKTSPKS